MTAIHLLVAGLSLVESPVRGPLPYRRGSETGLNGSGLGTREQLGETHSK
jgi:hypothetical protein